MPRNYVTWSDDPRFAAWKLVPSTFTVSDDGTVTVYFILSPDAKYCALIRHEQVVAKFGALGARQVLGIGCELLFADSFDAEVFGSDIETEQATLASDLDEEDFDSASEWAFGDDEALDSGAAADAALAELEIEDLEVVDFSSLSIYLSPTGQTLALSIQKNNNSYIFCMADEQRLPLIAGELMSMHFAERGEHYFLSVRSEDGEDYFTLDGTVYDGMLHDCGFSDCGSHSIAFVGHAHESSLSIYVNGNEILTAAKVQSWNYLGDGGSQACSKLRFVFDPKCRYLLFAIGEQDPDAGPSSVKRSLQILRLQDLKLHAWPEVRVLNASWCEQSDNFKLSVLLGADGFRKPFAMSVPCFDD